MKAILSSSDIQKSSEKLEFWNYLKKITIDENGYLYYKYPISGTTDKFIPDFSIIDLNRGICIIDLCGFPIENIYKADDVSWIIDDSEFPPLTHKLEDFVVGVENRLRTYREIRNKIQCQWYIYFPFIHKKAFSEKFGVKNIENFLFKDDSLAYPSIWKNDSSLNHYEKLVFKSVIQGAGPINKYSNQIKDEKSEKIGQAIKLLDKKLALLDDKQHEAAIQIPDGPQRIRGLAGTGKTIILTMKAAYLHGRYPDRKILYTFHTQSLYNQIRDLITKFYRDFENNDPNWDNLLIMHSWGGKTTNEGVYYRTCLRNSIRSLGLNNTPYGEDSFDHVCKDVLKHKLIPEFDFSILDESQDFPASFFQLVYRITKSPKRIIFAYDELQTLGEIVTKNTIDLFGTDTQNKPLVDFSEGEYFGGIEMDFILKKTYRNPSELMLVAHGIGMGIYNQDGIMQIIEDKHTWESIGYILESGELEPGSNVVFKRPEENSISLVHECYSGKHPVLSVQVFKERIEEIDYIASEIKRLTVDEKVLPHNIVVISLDPSSHKALMPGLQSRLHELDIPSIIPGSGGVARDKFAEAGFVTLSTVFKAKGNEAFIVFVANFDFIYDYLEFVRSRNRAFTAITRTKGWCYITGFGEKMERAVIEIEKIRKNYPLLKFVYPDHEKVARQLSQEEYARRVAETKKAKLAIDNLLKIDKEAISKMSTEQLDALRGLLNDNR